MSTNDVCGCNGFTRVSQMTSTSGDTAKSYSEYTFDENGRNVQQCVYI